MGAAKALLVVDDNEITREGIGTVLSREGYTVGLIATAREALEYLRRMPRPDLILLDMFMPGLDGWAFLKEIQADATLAQIPILIITAMSIATDEWAQSLGAIGLLRKPFDTPTLLEVVRHYCGE